jgi:hypothetical protein
MMYASKTFFFLLSALLMCSCTPVEKEKEDHGKIVMEVATRGSYQYLIQIGEESYYPENLPEDFKESDLRVKIKYREKGYHKDIFMPAPNDVPVKKFSAPVIYLTEIEKI